MQGFIQQIQQQLGTTPALATAYIIVSALIAVMAVVCLVLELRVWLKYSKANRMGISTRMTGIEAARHVLDHYGLKDVTVRESGFIREFLFGNYYNILSAFRLRKDR